MKVAKDIIDEKFPVTENQYCPCDFAEHYPYYQQKTAPPQETDALKGMVVDEAVE